MKKIITVTLCIVLVLLFAGCGKNGDTSKVEIDYGASSIYSKEEIDSAIEIIKKQFALFEGCELHRLSYMTDIGAFDDEPATVAMMDKYLEENGYVNDFTDERRHHEIYLSDPRKVAPEKCKTVIRHPIKKA